MHYYSFRWERIPTTRPNIIHVRTTFLDENGREHTETKFHEGWIGVCTQKIERVLQAIRSHFPGHNVVAHRLGNAQKILPYFDQRVARGKLSFPKKPFYKIYTTACIKNIGRFFHRYKFSYYDPDDWLVRIYIDLCSKYDSPAFYYKWYTLHDAPALLDAFRMVPERQDQPLWTFAAFDLETVPLQGNHVPMGHHPADRIVMISLYKWNDRATQRTVLYLLPDGHDRPLADYEAAFTTEAAMLTRFHELLDDAQILTGYNINAFDLPCLFARILWLKLYSLLRCYSSTSVGTDVVVTYRQKITLDLYAYFKTFSGYDLPSFKLDDVARVKLGDDAKLPIKAIGLWSWYRAPHVPRSLLEDDSVERCYRALAPDLRLQDFGTFRMYLEYCLKDSELVYRLFRQEHVLSFLVERANLTAYNAIQALHLGNSRFLLELFKTYGTRLGYFLNHRFFTPDKGRTSAGVWGGGSGGQKTYQGALNFCYPEEAYEDVAVMDFASMYPSTLLSSNLCYGTCAILSREDWLATPAVQGLTAIPFRQHSQRDFERLDAGGAEAFAYPRFDPNADDPFVMVVHQQAEAFLPNFVAHFLEKRRHHQRQWALTRDIYHYNAQLGIKILINSLYGVMASADSALAYLPIAVIIVTLARYQLLGAYHYLRHRGFNVCYADTDSLMVHRWPEDQCVAVTAFLGLPHVELKFEQRMRRLLVLSKKRYVYETAGGERVTKGFQKKVNGLVAFLTQTVLDRVWRRLFEAEEDPEGLPAAHRGWVVWAEMLQEAQYRCRDPRKYALYRKMKKLEQYVSVSCPAVKYLKKYPERTDEHVEFTYSRADVAVREASNWVMDADDCRWVDVEKLFIGQKKSLVTLLNLAYWQLKDPTRPCDQVLNALRWQRFVHAELLHWHATGRRLALWFEPGVRYTFRINDHLPRVSKEARQSQVVLGPDDI